MVETRLKTDFGGTNVLYKADWGLKESLLVFVFIFPLQIWTGILWAKLWKWAWFAVFSMQKYTN
jgi:hypothetical protein